MNFLNLLTNAFMTGPVLETLSAKTGLSPKTLKMILAIAIPLLIKKMTSNAASQSGANSLLSALGQHTNRGSLEGQIKDADEEDGSKIVGHILGDDRDDLIMSVAKETGVAPQDVEKVLGTISPSVLSGLSAATTQASNQQSSGVDLSDGFDMGDLMGMLGGASAGSNAGGAGGLLSSLFGGGQPAQSSGGLLGSLLGGGRPEEDQSVNGNQLLQQLLSIK